MDSLDRRKTAARYEGWRSGTVQSIASNAKNAIVGGPFGSDLVSNDYVEVGVPVIRGQNMAGSRISGDFVFVSDAKAASLESNLARPGDLIFTQRGTLGQVSIVPASPYDRYLISQSQMKLSVNRAIADEAFYFYVFSSELYQQIIQKNTIQTGVPHINLGILKQIPVPVPPIAEQRAIAAALGDVDGLIAALDRLIAKKRDLKQAAMQQLLTGRTRLPGFSGQWSRQPFDGALRRLNTGKNKVQTSEYKESGQYPVVDQGQERIVGYSDDSNKAFKCPEGGAIVFGDHTCITKYVDFDFIVGADGAQVLEARPGHSTQFIAYQMQYDGVQPTGYNRHFKILKEREFQVPSLSEQTAIATVLSDVDAEIAALEARRDKTRALKQGMMQELLTGRTRRI